MVKCKHCENELMVTDVAEFDQDILVTLYCDVCDKYYDGEVDRIKINNEAE